ncbi:MAG: SGNH/GDSL hydrolase family protein [Elusimicrobia bacterium]|nr:SGNH/GDSL hydrolase family protein [Elusimicrobiota bacterium]
MVRLTGRHPFKWYYYSNEPTLLELDRVLGWKNKAGTYCYPNYDNTGSIKITFWPGGLRATGPQRIYGKPRILVLGGSFTQGMAICDEETFAWKLQKKFPSMEFLNFGTGGYGTYQSLLVLEKYFKQNDGSPRVLLVLYGFHDLHIIRNAAPWSWLKYLYMHKNRQHVALPYCHIDSDNSLLRYPPKSYIRFPFSDYSALLDFLNDLFMQIISKKQSNHQALNVTFKLLIEMNTLCQKNKAKFVVILFNDSKNNIKSFLQENKIDYIECPVLSGSVFKVPGEGHPNGIMNSIYAKNIEMKLKEYEGLGYLSHQSKRISQQTQ